MNKKAKIKLYDFVHKTWVTTCITATGLGSIYLAYLVYDYFVNVKPLKKEIEQKFREELLKEGRMLTDTSKFIN